MLLGDLDAWREVMLLGAECWRLNAVGNLNDCLLRNDFTSTGSHTSRETYL